jgi:hypothetical protein
VKKQLTLLLLVVFLLNTIGYYGVFVGLKISSRFAMREQFDSETYNQEEVTFKIPLTLPYASNSNGYERIDGEFDHDGQVYRLVKQKLQSDTLYIICVKDQHTQKINQALADYVKSYTDKPINTKQSTKTVTVFSKDYLSTSTLMENASMGWNMITPQSYNLFDLYRFDFNQHIVQPPEA